MIVHDREHKGQKMTTAKSCRLVEQQKKKKPPHKKLQHQPTWIIRMNSLYLMASCFTHSLARRISLHHKIIPRRCDIKSVGRGVGGGEDDHAPLFPLSSVLRAIHDDEVFSCGCKL